MTFVQGVGAAAFMLSLGFVTGCEAIDSIGPGSGRDVRNFDGEYAWVHQTWNGSTEQGYPVVNLSWQLPSSYSGEVFRIYSRRSSGGVLDLIATVTSCSQSVCRYTDTNVLGGQSYEYSVSTYDDRSATEVGISETIRVDVLARPNLAAPGAPTAISLDGATYLRWTATGAQRYIVLTQPEGSSLFQVGETDGASFYDGRAENGVRYRYYVAAVDPAGHVSSLSQPADAFPRPDFFADVVYAHSDNPAGSGFRFVTSETQDPIVSGTSTSAQWRLEVSGTTLRIQPLGQTLITAGTFTTQLSCGPGSDASCVDIRTAPAAAQLTTTAATVQSGFTYVLRVVGADNRTHYAKMRVQGSSVDAQGRRLIVFDWAYQLRPDEVSLSVMRD
jgi:hypothetical protein